MPREKRKTTRDPTGRQERIPLGHIRPKMAVQASPGMVGRWVNDVGGRIQAAEKGGYQKVFTDPLTPEGERRPLTHMAGVAEGGGPLIAYYMEIPKKLYEADQKAKQELVDSIDEAISQGNIEGEVGKEGRYVPPGGISIRTG